MEVMTGDSQLKDMLNGIYYNSEIGDCYQGNSKPNQCDFTGNGSLPKGLKDVQDMIDNDVIWNLGSWDTSSITSPIMYEKERGKAVYQNRPIEWSKETEWRSAVVSLRL